MQDIGNREDLKIISGKNCDELQDLGKIIVEMGQGYLENETVHGEIKKYLQMFDELLSSSRSREMSLQSLIEAKEMEYQEIEDKTRTLLTQSEKLDQEHNHLANEAKFRQSKSAYQSIKNQNFAPTDWQTSLTLLQNLNEVGQFWRDTDTSTFEQSISETRDLLQSIDQTSSLLSSGKTQNSDLSLKLKIIQDSIKPLESSDSVLQESSSKLSSILCETGKLQAEKENLQSNLSFFQENIEKLKSEKENLANKLEEIYEKLVNERTHSAQLLEDYTTSRSETEKIKEKLIEEKILQKRLNEQLGLDKENFSKLSKDLHSGKDLDEVLDKTLTELNASNTITKNDSGQYLHNNTPISLYLHQESFLVVQDKSGPIPLTDFLLTAIPAIKSKSRSENSRPETEKSKSPLRPIPSNFQSKLQKSFTKDKKKSFK